MMTLLSDFPLPQQSPSVHTSQDCWGLHPIPVPPLNKGVLLNATLLSRVRLRVECERWLNMLEVLFGRSWDGDRTVMLRLHYALIFSTMDGGCPS